MRRTSATLVTRMVIAVALTCSAVQAGDKKFDGYIIKLRNTGTEAISDLESSGIRIQSRIPQLGMIFTRSLPSKITARAQSRIEYIEPNYYRRIVGEVSRATSSNEGATLWGMKKINAPAAWATSIGNKSVVVAISDTGIWKHPDLTANFWVNRGEIPNNKKDDDGNGFIDDVNGWNFETNSKDPTDDHYHGTHVSGTIGAVHNGEGVAGVVGNVSLMAVKFIGRDGYGTDVGGIGTILYAADNGARVLNASWGGDEYSKAIFDAVEYARTKSMLVVCAAGNDGRNADQVPMYPAAYDSENIISVAAGNTNKKQPLASFSNFGIDTVDLVAPGEHILSTFNPLYSQLHRVWFMELDGTSMAAPHVTGAAALLLGINPNLTWQQLKEILLNSVTPEPKFAGKVKTGGWLNVDAAAKMAAQLR